MPGTPFASLIESFLHKVEKDKQYFKYFELTDAEAMELARQRAGYFLEEAIGELIVRATPTVDFTDIDPIAQCFNFDLTPIEKHIIPWIMYQIYVERDLAYLKSKEVNFVDKNLKTYDPSNARQSYKALLDTVIAKVNEYIDIYRNSDRSTGAYLPIDFTVNDAEELNAVRS